MTANKPASPARAREERVQRVMDMMRRGEWVRGRSGPTIAASMGVSPTTMEDIAAEAWRRVAAEVTEPKTVRENVAHVLTLNLERASDEGDYKGVAALATPLAKLVGANAPERSELTVKTEVDQYATLPAEERLRIARDVVAEWSGEVARLEAELGVVTMLGEGR